MIPATHSREKFFSDLLYETIGLVVAAAGALAGTAIFALTGLGVMVALAGLRASGFRDLYERALRHFGFGPERLNATTLGQWWKTYLSKRKEYRRIKASGVKGIFANLSRGYGAALAVGAYWAIPTIFALSANSLRGAFTVVGLLLFVHFVTILAQVCEVAAWARNQRRMQGI